MSDLKNTIAHILEHGKHLAEVMENANDIIDDKSAKQNVTDIGEWTIARVRDLLPQSVIDFHKANFSKERLRLFYRGVTEVQNLSEKE